MEWENEKEMKTEEGGVEERESGEGGWKADGRRMEGGWKADGGEGRLVDTVRTRKM